MSLSSHWTTGAIIFGIGMLYLVLLFLEEWLLLKDEGRALRRFWPKRMKHG